MGMGGTVSSNLYNLKVQLVVEPVKCAIESGVL